MRPLICFNNLFFLLDFSVIVFWLIFFFHHLGMLCCSFYCEKKCGFVNTDCCIGVVVEKNWRA